MSCQIERFSLLEAVSKFSGECSSVALARLGNENSARMNADHEDFPVLPWSLAVFREPTTQPSRGLELPSGSKENLLGSGPELLAQTTSGHAPP
jgi:hypothetical protein